MKLSSNRNTDLFYIDWWLHNHNSHKASYEHDLLHCGNISYPYLKDCKRLIEQTTLYASKLGKRTHISFTGGEVTEWTDFVDLLKYAKDQNCLVRFSTNCTNDTEILESAFRYTDGVNIEIHPEFANVAHTLIILKILSRLDCTVSVNINMMPERWTEMLELYSKIYGKYSNISVTKKMLFDDPIFNTSPQSYNEEQIICLKAQTGDLIIEDQGHTQYTNFQTLVLEQKNKFTGFKCWAGIEQIIVDAWGRVHRGHCRKNGFMGTISDAEIFWYPEPLICKVEACVNQFDIQATKQSLE